MRHTLRLPPLLAAILLVSLAARPLAALNITRIGHLVLPGQPQPCNFSDALFVHDDRAYVMATRGEVNGSSCINAQGWLYVIDVSDPAAPAILSQTRLRSTPGDMHSIYYSNGYVYCGMQFSLGGGGVSVYDVADPRNPVEVAFIAAANSLGAHNLRVADHRLYQIQLLLGSTDAIVIHDVSNPRSPRPLGGIPVGGGTACHDLSVMENVGYASCYDDPGLVLFDLTDPANVTVIGSFMDPLSTESLHSMWPLPDRWHVITCQEIEDRGVKTWDISTGTPAQLDQYDLGAASVAHDVMVVGRYAYVTYYRDGVRILDLADPASLVEVGSFTTGAGNCMSAFPAYCDSIAQWLEDGLLFVTDTTEGLFVLSFDLPHPAPITMYAVKTGNASDAAFTWNHTGESQYTLRDGLSKRVPGTALTDIDGRLSHVETGVLPGDGRLHYYKLNGPWG